MLPGYGIGLAHAYSGTMALDIDNWDVAAFVLGLQGIDIRALYDAPDAVVIDSGKAGRGKLLYVMPDPLRTKRVTTNGETTYELRCATSSGLTVQDVLPPSIHPETNQPYRWMGRGHWTRVPTIPTALLQHWQSLIIADDRRTTITDGTASLTVSWDEIRDAVQSIPPDTSRENWINVGMALHWAGTHTDRTDDAFIIWDEWSQRSEEKYPGQRQLITQWKSFRADKESTVRLGTLFSLAHGHGYMRKQVDISGMFSEIKVTPAGMLNAFRPTPPDINIDIFPKVLARRVKEVAKGIGCDPLVPLWAGLSAVCAVVDARSRLELKENFQVPPVLWLMTIGDPGDKKTPGSQPMLKLMSQLEKEDHQNYAAATLMYEAAEAQYAAAHKHFLEASQTQEGMLDPSSLPYVPPIPLAPVPLKLTVSDVTSQRLVRLVADRPKGVLCYLDEMNSWVRKMTDKSSGDDRSAWVQGNNAASYSMERVGSGSTLAENFAVSIYGNIQPEVFRANLAPLTSDGLLQRFVPAVMRRERWGVGQPLPDDQSNITEYEQMLRLIFALPPATYTLSEEAKQHFNDFQIWYEAAMWDERLIGTNNMFVTAMGKIEGLLGRFTLVNHIIENPFSHIVSGDCIKRTIQFIRGYVIPSYRFTFGDYSGVDCYDAWITERVIQEADKPQITFSELRRSAKRQTMYMTDHQVEQATVSAMDLLESVGWVKLLEQSRGSYTWSINPDLAVRFKQERQIILDAKKRQLEEIYALRGKPQK
jgi:hypothetical protein